MLSKINAKLKYKRKLSLEESNKKFYILNGLFFTIMMNLFNPFLGKFLDRVGGTNLHFTLYKALPGLVALFTTLPGLYLINSTKSKKKTMFNFFVFSRLFLLLIALIPLFPAQYQPFAFVVLITLRYFPESVSLTSLQSFTGDIFRERNRASAIASKNRFSVLAQLLVSLFLFFILNFVSKGSSIIHFYQLLFVTAFVFSIFELYFFRKLNSLEENENKQSSSKINFKEMIKTIGTAENKSFYRFVVCSLIFHFGWQMGWPLFEIYQIKYLKASEQWLITFNVISSLVMFFGYKFWNKKIYTQGNKKIMAITTMGMAATPILFALSPNLYVLACMNIVTGFFTSGTVTVLLSSLLEVAPEKNRILYIGLHATFTNLTLCIAPLVGNFVHEGFNIYAALILSGIIRLAGSTAFFINNRKEI